MIRQPVLGMIAALLSVAAVAQTSDRVQVRYVHPEKFTDAGRYWGGDKSREANLETLARHIRLRAAPLLPEGASLAVEVIDVDLAGGYEPWHAGLGDRRVVRDVYPPRIDLSFRLAAGDGSVLKEGERRLRNLAFATSGAAYRDDPLRYEKALIDSWLEHELQSQAGR